MKDERQKKSLAQAKDLEVKMTDWREEKCPIYSELTLEGRTTKSILWKCWTQLIIYNFLHSKGRQYYKVADSATERSKGENDWLAHHREGESIFLWIIRLTSTSFIKILNLASQIHRNLWPRDSSIIKWLTRVGQLSGKSCVVTAIWLTIERSGPQFRERGVRAWHFNTWFRE